MRRCPIAFALAACLCSAPSLAAPLPCDAPSLPPAEVSATAGPNGTHIHVLVGTIGTCNVSLRDFRLELPSLQGLRGATAQLSLAGFTRRYGLHQIGFTLRKVDAAFDPQGVNIRFTAITEGLDSFQLAYTLYVTTSP